MVPSLRLVSAGCLFALSVTGFGVAGQKLEYSSQVAAYPDQLNQVVFRSKKGSVQLYSLSSAGNRFTGTVKAVPAGNTAIELERNRNLLKGTVIEARTEDGRKENFPVSEGRYSLDLPEDARLLSLVLRNSLGKILGRALLPLTKTNVPGTAADRILLPVIVEGGEPVLIEGSFNHDFEDTRVLFGETPAGLLAESSGGVYVLVPTTVEGPVKVLVGEAGQVLSAFTAVYHTRIRADKTTLEKGETGTIHYSIAGLPPVLPPAMMIQVENQTASVVSLSGGDRQVIPVLPTEITPGGKLDKTFRINALRRGDFRISFSLSWDENFPEQIPESQGTSPTAAPVTNESPGRNTTQGPVITGISTEVALTGMLTTLTLFGKGFQDGSTVNFLPEKGISKKEVTCLSPGEMRVRMEVSQEASDGYRDIVIVDPDGRQMVRKRGLYILNTNTEDGRINLPTWDYPAGEEETGAGGAGPNVDYGHPGEENPAVPVLFVSLPQMPVNDLLLILPGVLAGLFAFYLLTRPKQRPAPQPPAGRSIPLSALRKKSRHITR